MKKIAASKSESWGQTSACGDLHFNKWRNARSGKLVYEFGRNDLSALEPRHDAEADKQELTRNENSQLVDGPIFTHSS
ncbi:hypothetical protein TSAR_009583 [Trichomalopsis sarcophagae]|uniref:Uncharacterized protein n=1 Tax=Trichomalopsis sarcophagae TaxID=543379 RepID=A0A232FGU9_9HYME|nr:hypothetical protein TSAR_009583 [Trichomalopsis sarcophagae]